MDWNSIIKNDNDYGTIILTIYGDINMSKNTNIIAENYGNIYIFCNNLIMRKGSNILTCKNDKSVNDNLTKETHVFGNIYLNVKHSIIMDKVCLIQSGNTVINCNSLKIRKKSRINALRNNLEINAKNGIEYDDEKENDVFSGENNKHLNSSNNMLKIEDLLAPTNLTHALSMFRETSEFECIICLDNEPCIMIKPCGHSNYCIQCIDTLQLTQCPICRSEINGYYDFNNNKTHIPPKIEIEKEIDPQMFRIPSDDESSYTDYDEDDDEDDDDEDDDSSSD